MYLIILAIFIAVGGIVIAWSMYGKKSKIPDKIQHKFPGLYKILLNKYYIDEFYQKYIVEPIYRLMKFLWNFDSKVVDGAVNGSTLVTVLTSRVSSLFDLRTVDGAVNGVANFVRFFS